MSTSTPPLAPSPRPLALVADDDPSILELVLIRLARLGYETLAARDGEEALRLAREQRPELVVLDVAMPSLDGLEVARRLSEGATTREIAVIFLSARVSDADVSRGYEAGGAEYIKKPFSPRELTEAVKRKQAELALRRAEAETRALASEQAALHRVASAVARGERTEATLALVAREVAGLLGAEGGHVIRFDGHRDILLGSWRSPTHPEQLRANPVRLLDSGAITQVRATGAPARVESPRLALRCRLAAPVYIERSLWGAIAVAATRPETIGPEAEARLGHFADLVAVAITNAEAHAQLARQGREQAALRRIATLVASEAEPRTIFREVAREAAGVLGAERGSVVRFDEDGEWGQIVGTWTHEGAVECPPHARLPLGGASPVAGVKRTEAAARMDDLSQLDPISAGIVPPSCYRSAAAVPIREGARLWGAVAVASAEELPATATIRLSRFGDLVALGLANADARAQLAALASTDHLTGLPNKRSFNDFLAGEVERSRRHGRDLSLVMLDLDHFKLVNDGHGHPVGDRVLVEAARRIAALARGQDTVARVGGEEFAWVMPETDATGAMQAAERAREAVASDPFPEVGTLTVSAGACDLASAGAEAGADELFRLADVMLYRAKQGGRNRTEGYVPGSVGSVGGNTLRTRTLSGILALVHATDSEAGVGWRHSERVAALAERLALARGWTPEEAEGLRQAGQLHDVGKIAVPDTVLRKAGPLDQAEHEQVQAHVTVGAQLLANLLSADQVTWVRHHHERYDGNGYPDGLAGDAIPAGARLLALAEAWDAMTGSRAYAPPLEQDDALAECRGLAGRQFASEDVAALEGLAAAGLLARASETPGEPPAG